MMVREIITPEKIDEFDFEKSFKEVVKPLREDQKLGLMRVLQMEKLVLTSKLNTTEKEYTFELLSKIELLGELIENIGLYSETLALEKK